MVRCTLCKQETTIENAYCFYTRVNKKKSPTNYYKCTSCYRSYHREYAKSYYKKNTPKLIQRTREYRLKFPEKSKARNILANAIRRGKIKKPDVCEFGCKKTRIEGHHEDYSKPLTVRWLCSVHHRYTHLKKTA